MKPLIIYHADCLDGFGAAMAAYLKHGSDGAEYIAAKYGQPAMDCTDRDVHLLDFSYPYEDMVTICNTARSVMVLDHHKTAENDLRHLFNEGRITGKFDMDKSGARLAWEYYIGEPHGLIIYIEDRDLWRFKWGQATKAICAALSTYPKTFDDWLPLFEGGGTLGDLAKEGQSILRYQQVLVDEIVATARPAQLACMDQPVMYAECPYSLASQVGNDLAKLSPSGVSLTSVKRDDGISYSLRSTPDVDVSAIAKHFGGGGHKCAAGFRTQWRIV